MRHAWKVVLVGILLVFCVPFAVARMPGDGWGHGQGRAEITIPRYNPATEMTMKGTVEAVTTSGYGMGMGSTRLAVRTAKEVMEVRVGPTWFVEQKMTFANGDQVEVTGSRVKFGTMEWLIAREVKKGGQTLTLRDMPVRASKRSTTPA